MSRAVSPVIATTLLVLVTIAAGVVIYAYATNFLTTTAGAVQDVESSHEFCIKPVALKIIHSGWGQADCTDVYFQGGVVRLDRQWILTLDRWYKIEAILDPYDEPDEYKVVSIKKGCG